MDWTGTGLEPGRNQARFVTGGPGPGLTPRLRLYLLSFSFLPLPTPDPRPKLIVVYWIERAEQEPGAILETFSRRHVIELRAAKQKV